MDIPSPLPAQPTRFLDKVRSFIRLRGMAYKTEKTYLFWIKRFIRFHDRKHPEVMGTVEVEAFLSHLVLQANVSTATQRVALNALVFLYRELLGQPLEELSFERGRKPKRLPTALWGPETPSSARPDGSETLPARYPGCRYPLEVNVPDQSDGEVYRGAVRPGWPHCMFW